MIWPYSSRCSIFHGAAVARGAFPERRGGSSRCPELAEEETAQRWGAFPTVQTGLRHSRSSDSRTCINSHAVWLEAPQNIILSREKLMLTLLSASIHTTGNLPPVHAVTKAKSYSLDEHLFSSTCYLSSSISSYIHFLCPSGRTHNQIRLPADPAAS